MAGKLQTSFIISSIGWHGHRANLRANAKQSTGRVVVRTPVRTVSFALLAMCYLLLTFFFACIFLYIIRWLKIPVGSGPMSR